MARKPRIPEARRGGFVNSREFEMPVRKAFEIWGTPCSPLEDAEWFSEAQAVAAEIPRRAVPDESLRLALGYAFLAGMAWATVNYELSSEIQIAHPGGVPPVDRIAT